MKLFNSKRSSVLSISIAVLALLGGVYVLFVTLSPEIASTPFFIEKQKKIIEKNLEKPAAKKNTLYIPKIGLKVDIIEGIDESALLKGAWHRLPENGNPEKGGNFVLSAHRLNLGYTPGGTVIKSPFYNIDRLDIGDNIFVDYNQVRYLYKIAKKSTVAPTQTSIESKTNEPQLTLYSCTLRGSSDGRDVVIAKPSRVEDNSLTSKREHLL